MYTEKLGENCKFLYPTCF